jgi:type IV pilus assembly protein PilE
MALQPAARVSLAQGFTLIELMVVVVIATILLSLAIPSYMAQIRQSRRVEAKTAVLDLAGREERFFSTNGSLYTQNSSQLGLTAVAQVFPITIGSNYYQVTVCSPATPPASLACNDTTPAAPSFQVVATPVPNAGQDKDSLCQLFGVDSTGRQWANDINGNNTSATCWAR